MLENLLLNPSQRTGCRSMHWPTLHLIPTLKQVHRFTLQVTSTLDVLQLIE